MIGRGWSDWHYIVTENSPYGELREDPALYGYRDSKPMEGINEYIPDQKDGCKYRMQDAPGIDKLWNYFRARPLLFKIGIKIRCRILMNIINVESQNVVHSELYDFRCNGELSKSEIENHGEPPPWPPQED